MRAPRNSLSPELIVAASLDALERDGVKGLSFRKLGAALNVDPTALYRHFRNKDELILAVTDSLMVSALDDFEPDDDWLGTIRDLMHRGRRAYLSHPHAAVLGVTRVTRRPGEIRIVEEILAALSRGGFDPEEAARLYRVIDDLNLAFAGLDAAFRILPSEEQAKDTAAWSNEYAALDAERFPFIAKAAPMLATIQEDPTYELAVDLLLESVARRAVPDAEAKR
ncbi:TetR/AcrR family transcriptional regulator [Arthrobacter echini]|uniref:TetR/AcrR family transcriptional regulator n=1 Tax=Arthrobacter echini TaxID=1529066 RepID=A0A5D0XRF5_9MICC|nr:TetR/AcrR family transcriptional regulator [Arthrobacter echini]